MDFWLLAFQGAAVAFVITRSGLFAPLRDHGPAAWRSFIECPLCVGVWAGMFLTAAQLLAAGYRPIGAMAILSWATVGLGTGALAGLVALGFTVAIDCADSVAAAVERLAAARPAMPRVSFPDESPTDPAPYDKVTRSVSLEAVAEAERAIAEKQRGK